MPKINYNYFFNPLKNIVNTFNVLKTEKRLKRIHKKIFNLYSQFYNYYLQIYDEKGLASNKNKYIELMYFEYNEFETFLNEKIKNQNRYNFLLNLINGYKFYSKVFIIDNNRYLLTDKYFSIDKYDMEIFIRINSLLNDLIQKTFEEGWVEKDEFINIVEKHELKDYMNSIFKTNLIIAKNSVAKMSRKDKSRNYLRKIYNIAKEIQ